jgi:cell division FtsZ-interacting protein ZapD
MASDKEIEKFLYYNENQHSDINAIEEFKKQNIQAMDYLNRLDNISKVFEDQNAFNAVFFICDKKDIENFGYKVWIDVSDIHGSSLDSMGDAVERASCVLMCVTEKYRQSIYCQAEAKYSFELKKPLFQL